MPDKREEIPDVVLRLARQQLAKESAASPGCEPFELAAAAGDRLSANKTSAESEYIDQRDAAQVPSGGAAPTADPPPLPPDTDFKLQNDNPSNLQFEICNFQFAIPTPPGPALRSGGAHDKRVNVDGASTETPRAEPTPNRAASDTDLLLAAAFDPRQGGAAARLPALPQDDTASAGPPPIPPLRKGGPRLLVTISAVPMTQERFFP